MVGLRVVLAAVALVAFSLTSWALFAASHHPRGSRSAELVASGLCALVALSAAIDLLLLGIRSAHGDYRNN